MWCVVDVGEVDDVPSVFTECEIALVVLTFLWVVGEYDDVGWFDAHCVTLIFAYKYLAV